MNRRATLPTAFLSLFILAFSGCSNPAGAPSGDLLLLVLGVNEVPAQGIEVGLQPGDLQATTGADGKVLFEGLDVGDYVATLTEDHYETANASCTVQDGERTEQTVHLTGLPGSLLITALREGVPFNGGTVRVRDPQDGSLLFSEQVVSNGVVLAAGLPSRMVRVSVDTSANVGGPAVTAVVQPLETVPVSVAVARYASLFGGSVEFNNAVSHEVGFYEIYNNGASLRPIGNTSMFTGTFSLMSSYHGFVGVFVFGAETNTEYSVIFSPYYDATTAFVTVDLPLVYGRVERDSPADDVALFTDDLPIQLSLDYPDTDFQDSIWEVFYWWYENEEWNWTTAFSSDPQGLSTTYDWDGGYSPESSLSGQSLIADPEGSWYSWTVTNRYTTGYVSVTWDYFFTLADTSVGTASSAARASSPKPERATLREAMIERALQGRGRLFRAIPPMP